MTTSGVPRRGRASVRARVAARQRRLGLQSQVVLTAALTGLSVLIVLGALAFPDWVPPATFLLLLLVGAFLLRFGGMVVLCAFVLVEIVLLWSTGLRTLVPGVLVVLAISVVAVLSFARARARLGLQGAPGELMLVDLRDRLAAHGRIPPLPPGWRVDTALRSAHAEAFSGDFMVATKRERGDQLEMVLVDVSGKGQDAGVRSLLLSGAFGGLLGSMPRTEFLAAANEYLLSQAWEEGFATAVHVAVHLGTGEYWISSAGHPPAVHLHAGSGRIDVVDTVGSPALGVVGGVTYTARSGRLDHGDVLLLYTDGLVEMPGYDLDLGIDRLMGAAEQLLATRRGGAEAVLAEVRAGENDDRALVLLHRD
ncbi:PP2C family protein-serine/threonine phosphatase [Cellulomonas sp. NPDC055163]